MNSLKSIEKQKYLVPLALAGVLGTSACSTVIEGGQVTGWAVLQKAEVYRNDWVFYRSERRRPSEENIRGLQQYQVTNGDTCIAYDTNGGCTFSVPNYESRYNFERFEPVRQRVCSAEIDPKEFPNTDIQRDRVCEDTRNPEEWVELLTPTYHLEIDFVDNGEPTTCVSEVRQEDYTHSLSERELEAIRLRGACNVVELIFANSDL